MNILHNSYAYIAEFINQNKGKYSESYIAAIVKTKLTEEYASESAIDTIMLQAKPMTILGERLIEKLSSLEAAHSAIPEIVDLLGPKVLDDRIEN